MCNWPLRPWQQVAAAKSLNGVALPLLLPSITIQTDPRNVTPIRQIQKARFDG